MLFTFPETFDLSFPQPFSNLLALLRFPSLDFTISSTSLSCYTATDYYHHVITITVIPLLAVATIPLVVYFMKVKKLKQQRRTTRRVSVRDRLQEQGQVLLKYAMAVALIVAYLVMPISTTAILKVFR